MRWWMILFLAILVTGCDRVASPMATPTQKVTAPESGGVQPESITPVAVEPTELGSISVEKESIAKEIEEIKERGGYLKNKLELKEISSENYESEVKSMTTRINELTERMTRLQVMEYELKNPKE